MMEELCTQVVERIESYRGGWCEIARRSGCDRSALYRSFKMKGRRPTLATLLRVLPHIGMKLELTLR